jgi:hypothetical protein
MAKKHVGVSLRKPPRPVEAAEAFVAAGTEENAAKLAELRALAMTAITPTPTAQLASAPIVVAPSNGLPLREVTLYLPKDLAQRLSVHCTERDCDVSNVIADAVSRHLETTKPKKAKPTRSPGAWRSSQAWLAWENAVRTLRSRIFAAK